MVSTEDNLVNIKTKQSQFSGNGGNSGYGRDSGKGILPSRWDSVILSQGMGMLAEPKGREGVRQI